MSNPNRLKVYYLYRCASCERTQHRGSRAKRCNLPCRVMKQGVCGGPIYRVQGGKAHTRQPRIVKETNDGHKE